MKNFACLDGEANSIELGEAVMGSDKVGDQYVDPSVGEMMYNANGLFSSFKKNRAERLKQKRVREESKADARKTKAQAKLEAAKAQAEAAKALGNTPDNTAALLAQTTPVQDEKKSKAPLYIGLGIGAVVLGIVGFVIYKKMKKNK